MVVFHSKPPGNSGFQYPNAFRHILYLGVGIFGGVRRTSGLPAVVILQLPVHPSPEAVCPISVYYENLNPET